MDSKDKPVTTVNVNLKEKSYGIEITENLLSTGSARQLLPVSNQYAIISNQQIADLYLQRIEKLLPENAKLTICLIPDSETSKSPEQFLRLIDLLLAANFNRSSTVIALGGGVVGDLAGFVAATLHRGCNLVQIPTSLLAQVDSSVGGKTAINHPSGKNLIGSFYQPQAVLVDPVTLKTLDKRQFSAGMAEVIKYAFLHDNSFLPWLEQNSKAIQDFDMSALEKMISHCCSVKAAVVSEDEKEVGRRVLLNFGHTFGHAIENISGYGQWLHGEAVAVGMLLASKLSVDNNLMDQQYYDRLVVLLKGFGLPISLPNDFSAKELLIRMYRDKKNLDQRLQLVLPRGAGSSELMVWNDDQSLLKLMEDFGASA
ncbi:MAG: 3-dehydroquinate synthase [Gammaproteobacteria bacterium]|nr:MAG: 3-dehydroquinate synthase [Gammaproteobacteria bacterium]